ncbi:MAG: hypothetical protein OWR62_14905, partial [Sulfobacillus thermotolerans]|nr:hypothetical protein [Sulfobacillus thermotolerans]
MLSSTKYWAISGMTALVGLGLTACGSAPPPVSTGPSSVSHLHPSAIIATPQGTLSATAPEPNGTLWVLAGNGASKGIYQYDVSQRKALGSESVSNNVTSIAQSSTGLLALGIGTVSSGAVEVANGTSGGVLATIPVSGPVYSVAAGDDGVSFYVLNGSSQARSVTVINGQTDKVVGNVPVPANAVSVVPSPGEHNVYVLQPNGVVSEITVAGGHITTQFSIGHSGRALALGPNGATLYVLKGQGPI